MNRCKFILEVFMIERKGKADHYNRHLKTAREKLNLLATQPEMLRETLEQKMKERVRSVTEGNQITSLTCCLKC